MEDVSPIFKVVRLTWVPKNAVALNKYYPIAKIITSGNSKEPSASLGF